MIYVEGRVNFGAEDLRADPVSRDFGETRLTAIIANIYGFRSSYTGFEKNCSFSLLPSCLLFRLYLYLNAESCKTDLL